MFDADFFNEGTFLEAVQEFGREHGDPDYRGDAALRVEIVTRTGDRLDILQVIAAETGGAMLSTRDERLVFVPYKSIAHIEVSVLQDHRIPGFRTPTSSE